MTRKARRDCSETMLAPGWRLTIAWILVRAWPGEERKTWRSFRGRGEGSPGLPTTRIGGSSAHTYMGGCLTSVQLQPVMERYKAAKTKTSGTAETSTRGILTNTLESARRKGWQRP